jgi:serine/threonine protein kinase
MTPELEQITRLMHEVADRAYAELIEALGPDEAAEQWAELFLRTGADVYLNLEQLDLPRAVAVGGITMAEGMGFAGPDCPLPSDLYKLFWDVRGVAALRTIYDHFGYGEPPYQFMFEGFEARAVITGGMGVVLEAYDRALDRKVAIKLWSQDGPAAQNALLAEAKTLAKFTHPNVVSIYGTGCWRERVYFVMEWIDGADGYAWLQQPRTWREVLEVFLAAGEGLAAAHDAGIQHRDFKPSNMLIGNDGRVVVADFGLADSLGVVGSDDDDDDDDEDKPEYPLDVVTATLLLDVIERMAEDLAAAEALEQPLVEESAADEPDAEQPAKVVGTRCYVAPECLRFEGGDARSDQFSFCVALWEALHGCRPYAGRSRTDVLESIERGAIQHGPRTHLVPHWLSRVVRKGLAEDPDQRFGSMRELLQALRDEPPEVEESDEADASAVDEGAAGLLNAPATGGPTWRTVLGATLGASLGAMVLGGLLVRGAMLEAFEQGRESERASRDQPIAELMPSGETDSREIMPSLTADMPCVLSEYDPTPVDPVVLEVCQMIRRNDFQGANQRWLAVYEERLQARREVGGDTLIVARTFDAHAKTLKPDAAEVATGFAHVSAGMAVVALPKSDPRQVEAVQLSSLANPDRGR